MLAQDIMCHLDADVLTYSWMDTQEHLFVDYSISRKSQDIMCHVDADILTYSWMDTQEHLFVDYSISRKCRKFDDTLSWKEEHKVEMDRFVKMEKSAGVRQVPAEDEYYAMYGSGGSDLFPGGVGFVPTKAEIRVHSLFAQRFVWQ